MTKFQSRVPKTSLGDFNMLANLNLFFVPGFQVPYWTYTRLMIVFWLVIPYFDGAFYVYKNLVLPCFTIRPRILINWCDERKESPFVGENIRAEMKASARENGPESLEKLNASKSHPSSSNVAEKDIKAVEVIKEKEVTSASQVSQAEPNLTQTENRNFPAAETNERVVRVAAGRDLPETPASTIGQNDWTCPICNVTTQNDGTKFSHLKGKKHKAAYEALKANNLTSLLKIVPPPILKKTGKGPEGKTTTSNQFGNEHKEPETSASRRRSRRKNKAGVEHEKDGKSLAKENPNKETAQAKNSFLKCSICNVSCTSSINMASHLRGRMHLAQLRLSTGA
ncbi:TB2/DP1/HVA22-related protein [Parasponia andersonii]|uniref:TB2/DP1/HVA22-related protein n=1 Tax=Parasponia andersonii TaxID=3476 RepID=A0A2P5DET9_PARAD|nr:TB2/DP1/HVA22-related protein [Parasponia andersonii]